MRRRNSTLNALLLTFLSILLIGLTPHTVSPVEASAAIQAGGSTFSYSIDHQFEDQECYSYPWLNPVCHRAYDYLVELQAAFDSVIVRDRQGRREGVATDYSEMETLISDQTHTGLCFDQNGNPDGYFIYEGHVSVATQGNNTSEAIFFLEFYDDNTYVLGADFPSDPNQYIVVSGEEHAQSSTTGCYTSQFDDTVPLLYWSHLSFYGTGTGSPDDGWISGSASVPGVFSPLGYSVSPVFTWNIHLYCDVPTMPYKQDDPQWGNQDYGNPSSYHGKVRRYGCAMTSAAMLLNEQRPSYYINPGVLNEWLRSQPDGYKGSAVNWVAVARFAREMGATLYYHGKVFKSAGSDEILNQSLCRLSLPVVLEEPSPSHPGHSHFVLATGQTEVGGIPTWSINDPGYSRSDLTTYPNNTYISFRLFNGDRKGAMIGGGTDTIQILVTDPLGRQTGVRADGSSVNEIPGSNYSTESIDADDDPNPDPTPAERIAEIIDPMDGTYLIQIFGVASGDYTMHFFLYDSDQNPADIEVVNGTTEPGMAQTYVVDYAAAPGSGVGVSRLMVDGAVQLQGRPSAPDARWVVPLHVVVTPDGSPTPVFDQAVMTNDSGQFEVDGLTPGTYRLWVKGSHTLAQAQTINVTTGANPVSIGTLREGDANDSNSVTILDFSMLAAAFGKTDGQIGYDARADFNGDSAVTIADFALLALNFGQVGEAQ